MKQYFRIEIIGNKRFDVCCTHFDVCLLSGTFSIWNGVLDIVHVIRLDNIVGIELIDKDEAGIDYKCYNDISCCISQEGLSEVL